MIRLSETSRGVSGLEDMLTAAIGDHGYACSYVDLPVALLVLEIAKRAEDKPDWFVRGKWAMIQAIQQQIDAKLDSMFRSGITGEKT